MTDRFKLEEEFMKCWAVTDDIDILAEMIADADIEPKDMDKLLNAILGMKVMYTHKFQKTFSIMEQLIHDRDWVVK